MSITRGPVRALVAQQPYGVRAVPNSFISLTKKQKLAAAAKKVQKYRTNYLSCKQKQLNKGKTIYPEDPKGKCKADWKAWQKWRGKAGERAVKLAEKLEKQGRLDPTLMLQLQAVQAEALNEDPMTFVESMDLIDPNQVNQLAEESLSTEDDSSGPPWLLLGGAAAGATVLLILLLRR